MKKIFTLTALVVFGLTVQPAYSASFTKNNFSKNKDDGGKKKEISIGSDRASGAMVLHFTASKAGEASITVLNKMGKIVMQQTNQVTNRANTIALKKATALPEGRYTVQLTSNNKTLTADFLMWK
ncbi:MAG: T9SS type A sorting domain-containing protein [Ferruginibacter sp.]